MKLKNNIQDLIDKGEVDIEHHVGTSSKNDLGIYKDPIHDHSKVNEKGKGRDYSKISYPYDNVVGTTYKVNHQIAIVHIVGKNIECNATKQ